MHWLIPNTALDSLSSEHRDRRNRQRYCGNLAGDQLVDRGWRADPAEGEVRDERSGVDVESGVLGRRSALTSKGCETASRILDTKEYDGRLGRPRERTNAVECHSEPCCIEMRLGAFGKEVDCRLRGLANEAKR